MIIKYIIYFLLFISINISADIFDTVDEVTDLKNKKTVIFPISEKEYRKFIPLILRELTDEEIKEKKQKEAALNKEVKNTFVDKEKIKEIEKVKTEIKTDNSDVEFFDSLEIEEENNAPIDIEDPINKVEKDIIKEDVIKPITME